MREIQGGVLVCLSLSLSSWLGVSVHVCVDKDNLTVGELENRARSERRDGPMIDSS